MQFLTIKKHSRKRADGREFAQAFVIRKDRKQGPVREQQSISTKRPVLITGAHASGKSRWLTRLHADAPRVWPAKADTTPIYLSSIGSLAEWIDGRHLELWWAGREKEDGDTRHWSRLKPHERQRALPLYLEETGALLFVDDAHKLTGKKLEVVKSCVRSSKIWVISATDENRLAPGLRKDVLYQEPQTIRLDSEVAYDATPIMMWFLLAVAVSMGYWELAMALGGLRMLSGGRRAARQA